MAHNAPLIAHADGALDALVAALDGAVIDAVAAHDELSITVQRDTIADVMRTLRDDHEYQQLMEIAGVDYPERAERFEVVYHLLSVTKNHRLRIRVSTDEATPVPTIVPVWPNANWLEREVFDLYGVLFAGHPDLRRILTDYGFKGHPFRKDFPLTGYVELRYSEEAKRVVYEPVKLAQDFRSFDFMSPWEGADYILPGDEKAPAAPPATPVVATPKTTEKPADTGAGAKTDAKAAEKVGDGAPKDSAVTAPAPDATDSSADNAAPKSKKPRAVKAKADADALAKKPVAPKAAKRPVTKKDS
jgi:NADH-quinone oxidoreductase subunit C